MHATTFRALQVYSQVATPGAESAVYDCLVGIVTRRIHLAEETGVRKTDVQGFSKSGYCPHSGLSVTKSAKRQFILLVAN